MTPKKTPAKGKPRTRRVLSKPVNEPILQQPLQDPLPQMQAVGNDGTIKDDSQSVKTNRDVKLFFILVGFILIGFYLGTQSDALARFLTNPRILFSGQGSETISVKRLQKELETKKVTLINVHTPYEGEIAKTDTFIAYDDIIAGAGSLPKDRNTPIVLYCKSGRMSEEALATVGKLGYTNVRHLEGGMDAWQKAGGKLLNLSGIETEVLPSAGFELPVTWGDLGPRLISLGVIDLGKFKEAVKPTEEQLAILTGTSDQKIRITSANSQFIVDMLWALGLAQKSIVYEEGPMGKEYKKEAGNFASTGGWSLARGNPMDYLGRFDLIPLTPDQQKKVGEIAMNVYRPCCGNNTWFPDCNHGMAALAAIELMVAAGIPEKEIYRHVLSLNSFWFPDNYLYAATYFARQGLSWNSVDAKLVLSEAYSSAQGAGEVAQKVGALPFRKNEQGGGCGA